MRLKLCLDRFGEACRVIPAWLVTLIMAVVALSGTAQHFRMVMGMLAWHAAILMLPFTAAMLEAARRGVSGSLTLMLWGTAASGWSALLVIVCMFVDPRLGWLAAPGLLIFCAVICVRNGRKFELDQIARLMTPFAFCILYSGILLTVSIAPFGAIDQPLEFARLRFSHELPPDNAIPLLFARNVLSASFPSPMLGDWLGSDRPPLQSAYFLVSSLGVPDLFGSQRDQDLSYQIQGTLLQSFWLAGIWILVRTLGVSRRAFFGVILICSISGFAFVHGIFVWPKLFPLLHLCLIISIVLSSDFQRLSNWRMGALVGCNAALALLCHGGSFFALAGIAAYALCQRHVPSARFIGAAAIAGILVLLPWSIYQNYFDPPGDRLLKWHLAGVVDVDTRSFRRALSDAYGALTLRQFLYAKSADLTVIVGNLWNWPILQLKALGPEFSAGEAIRLRYSQFESVLATLGLFAWVPFMFFLELKRTPPAEMKASKSLLGLGLSILFIWTVTMYGDGVTSIHQGSLATVALLLSGSFLWCFATAQPLAWCLLFAQLIVTIRIYILPMSIDGFHPPGFQNISGFDVMLILILLFSSFLAARKYAND